MSKSKQGKDKDLTLGGKPTVQSKFLGVIYEGHVKLLCEFFLHRSRQTCMLTLKITSMFHQKPISTLGNPTHPSFLNERQPSLDTYLSISNLINKHYLQQCRRGLLFSHFIKSIGAFSHMA